MNLEIARLVSNDLRFCGSWPLSRSKRNRTLSMNQPLGGRAELFLSHTLKAARQRRPTRLRGAMRDQSDADVLTLTQ
jgi:hypothetical protein